jgi:hypothetical protein
MGLEKHLGGSARQFTYVASDSNGARDVSSLMMTLWQGVGSQQTVVSTHMAATSETGSYYVTIHIPSTPGNYAVQWQGSFGDVDGGEPAWWQKRKRFQIVLEEVD